MGRAAATTPATPFPDLDVRWSDDPAYATLAAQRADIVRRAEEADRARVAAEAAFDAERERAAEAEVSFLLGAITDKQVQASRRAVAAAEQAARDAHVDDQRYEGALARLDERLAAAEAEAKAALRERVRAEARATAIEMWDLLVQAGLRSDSIFWLHEVAVREQLGHVPEAGLYSEELSLPDQHMWRLAGAQWLARLGRDLVAVGVMEDPYPGC